MESIELRETTLGEALRACALQWGQNPAVIQAATGERVTWAALDALADQYAKGLYARGLRHGDSMVIWGTNRVEWVAFFLAAARIGVITVTANTLYQIGEIRHLLQETRASALIFVDRFRDMDYAEAVQELWGNGEACAEQVPSLHLLVHIGEESDYSVSPDELVSLAEGVSDEVFADIIARPIPTDPVCILFTSGSTRLPRGVVLSHRSIVNNAAASGARLYLSPQDKLCLAVPFFHCFGLSSGIVMSVCMGCCMVLVECYRPVEVMRAVQRYQCTAMHGVPTMYQRILEHADYHKIDFSSLRTGIVAGAACPRPLLRQIVQHLVPQLAVAYGQTETSPCCAQTLLTDPIERKCLSVGKALPFVEIRAVNPENGTPCAPGETGELCTRGYHVMRGYMNDAALSASVIDAEGWFHTGDMGFVDEDGYVHFVGRIKDIIVRGGENISPCELESRLCEHEAVLDARVVGVPDALYGEEVAACVRLCADSHLTEVDLQVWLRQRVARYKIPKFIHFMDDFPLTYSGKVHTQRLRDLIRERIGHQDSVSQRKVDVISPSTIPPEAVLMSDINKPLAGIKVVELATFIAVPACGRYLADLGAEVIKIEPPKGDNLRFTAPTEGRPLDHHENTTFDLENANKIGISLDNKNEAGSKIVSQLLEKADIFLTNWRPDALERAKLDYDSLKTKYPHLVYGNATGYGEKGPDRNLPGFDFTAFFARGGILGTLYQKGTVPMNVIPGLGDHQAGMMLAAGVLAALFKAKQTGKGEKVAVNLLHAAIYTQAIMVQASQYKDYGQVYPIDRRTTTSPFILAYKTSDDRFVQVCMPVYDAYYPTFISCVGREDLVNDERYNKLQNMVKLNLSSEMYDMLCVQFAKRPMSEWVEIFTKHDIPFSVAQTWEEILEDKQAWAIDTFYKMQYENGNERVLVRPPVDMEEMGLPPYVRGPLLGEHNAKILKDLGYSDAEIAKLAADKVIFNWS